MAWPVTINGNTYNAVDFSPYGYVTAFPNIMSDLAAVAAAMQANATGTAGETTVASAATTDIGASNNYRQAISGTTTITSFGTAANRIRYVRATGNFTITHNAVSLICPGGRSIDAKSGDAFIAASDGSGNWRILEYYSAGLGTRVQQPGQCKLVFVSATSIRLDPFNGNLLLINGQLERVPASGPTLSNSLLGASTLYYIYAFMSGTTMTLEASTTAYAVDTTYGHKIKSGDATRTLVGMARTNASSQFADNDAQRFLRTLYNDKGIACKALGTAVRTTVSTSFVEAGTEYRCEFIVWAGESWQGLAQGQIFNSSATGNNAGMTIGWDGTAEVTTALEGATAASINGSATCVVTKTALAEGYHFSTIMIVANAGTTTLNYGTTTQVGINQGSTVA